MLRQWPLKCLALGLLVTVAQVALAIAFANPEGSLVERWRSLVQHDSYWFANIIDRGYNTTLPPIDHKEMEVSNVAFFPAYPWLAETVARLTSLDTYAALLVTAEAATWGFWTYFFLLAERWELGAPLQVFGALAIVAHPAGFYLVAGYSESLFLASLVGFIYWCTREERGSAGLAITHGIILSATRIVGLPCAAFPVVHALFRKGWRRPGDRGLAAPNEQAGSPLAESGGMPDFRWRFRTAALVMLGSMLGGLAFFAYCQVRWGRWDIYMLTQNAGWAVEPDYLAAFKTGNYRWALPPFANTSVVSQFTSAVAGGLFLVIAAVEVLAAIWERTGWRTRIGIYFCAAVIYYLSLAGVASVQMESMLRYDLCVHALVVLGLLHFLRQCRVAPWFVRALAMGVAAVAFAAGLALQGFYVWNFTQGNWVA